MRRQTIKANFFNQLNINKNETLIPFFDLYFDGNDCLCTATANECPAPQTAAQPHKGNSRYLRRVQNGIIRYRPKFSQVLAQNHHPMRLFYSARSPIYLNGYHERRGCQRQVQMLRIDYCAGTAVSIIKSILAIASCISNLNLLRRTTQWSKPWKQRNYASKQVRNSGARLR